MKIPFNKIVKFGQSTMLEKDLFNVSWIRVDFAIIIVLLLVHAHSNKPIIDPEQYKKTIDEIKRQARDNGFTDFHFSFRVNPTAYKKFLELIEHYNQDRCNHALFI